MAEPALAITDYELTEQITLGKGVFQFDYRAAVTNTGSDALNVRATLESTPDIVEIIEPDLQFGDVPAGATELSDDTFTVRQARKGSRGDFPVDPMRFVWSFETGNSPPVADAGPDQTVEVGASVQLDGSGSSDPDGDLLYFNWSFVALPPDSAAALSEPTQVDPTFTADVAGSYTLELVVYDGELFSEADTVTITTGNSAPVADAGPDQTVLVTDTVYLDGSGSHDVNGDLLTFAWSFVAIPDGSTATLAGDDTVNPSFVVDLPGSYEIELVVNDGSLDSAPDMVIVTTENSPPVAEAGDDQTVRVEDTVQLDGSGSTDVDGDILSYFWSFVSIPECSTTTLSDPTVVQPIFYVDAAGAYVVQLIVNDGTVDSAADTVTITTENSPPIACAGDDQTVLVGTNVQLDGSGSSDPDEDNLTFAWSLTTLPADSNAILSDPTIVNPSFNADLLGEYVAQLIVNDGTLDSEPDTVGITTENSKPVAEAGEVQTVTVGDTVQLDGSGSHDADGHDLTFDWSWNSLPAGSQASLSNPAIVNPTFVTDLAGLYVPQLIVSDGWENSDPDTTTITAEPLIINTPPVADAGDDLTVVAGTTVFLDGSGSRDDDDDTLTYAWSFVTIPDGSLATLMAADTESPSFTPDLAGNYQVQLIVHDGTEPSTEDLVTVTATATNQPPVADAGGGQTVILGDIVHLDGSASDDPDGNPITYAWSLSTRPAGSSAVLLAAATATPYFKPDVEGGYEATLVVNDGTDDSLPDTVAITVNEEVVILPPDPATIAPPPDPTIATTVFDATKFLYTGDNPIQTGVEPGTIDPTRVTVLRGHIRDAAGAPLIGVTVTALDHPEYGQTLTRTDGMFDLAVNGGGPLVLDYRKTGYLGVQRHVEVPWQNYVWAEDAVMLQRDAQVTAVDLGDGTLKVARGSVSSDDDGSRQITLLFPAGTTATLEFPDGSTQPIDTLHVRATEFTVGEDGPDAMPAELPPQVGYTYCVEFSVDEAEALGAEHVNFSEPIPVYVENFVGFPVGGHVPLGYYDPEQGTWVPSPNGRVVEILGVQDDLALLDIDGSGQPADTAALAELGIADAERAKLADLYSPGQTLWRTPIPDFSYWDANWGMGPPLDAIWPTIQAWLEDLLNDARCMVGLCSEAGSRIGVQNQTLGEAVPVTGTPFALHYQSERVPGRAADRTLDIPVTGDEVPASMKRVDLQLQIAGRRIKVELPATPNQIYTFAWDGLDAYGQPLLGTHQVNIKVNYVYDVQYMEPADLAATFGYAGSGPIGVSGRGASEIRLFQEWQDELTYWDARGQGLGGFSISPHHTYDPVGKVLYRGDGGTRSAVSVNNIIETVAQPSTPVAVAVAPDGTLYTEQSGYVVRVTPDGTLDSIARPPGGSIQDLVFSPEGSLYASIFYDSGIYYTQYCYVARLEPDGTFTTIAGSPEQHGCGYSGDGGPATEAQLRGPHQIAFGPDGSLYLPDKYNYRIRKVSPDGIIETIAGSGEAGFSPDGTPALEADLDQKTALAVSPDGRVYFEDNRRVRRINEDGTIETVAGGGALLPDGVIATDASFNPNRINFSPDGSLFGSTDHAVVKVSSDGVANIVAGTWGSTGFDGDGGPPIGALLDSNYEVLPFEGLLYIADRDNSRIRRIRPTLPSFAATDVAIASTNGALLYHFDANGRHLETLNTLTAAVLYTFSYDENGLLTRIEDGDGNLTTIERDTGDIPLAIVAPFGQRTELALDPDGYLASVTDPLGQTHGLTYSGAGLLATLTDPRQGTHQYTYDDRGRLTRDQNPAGGDQTLARVREDDSYTVGLNTAEGRTSSYQVQVPPTLDGVRVNTFPDGTQNRATFGNDDGTSEVLYADGTEVNRTETGDPRFRLEAPVTQELTIGTPGGLGYLLTADRSVVLTDPNDLLSLETQTDTVNINGRTYTSLYDAAIRTTTTTTPAGRQTSATTDLQSRPTLVQIPGIEPIGFAYDTLGRLEQLTDGARATSFAYDPASGYLASTTNALSETTGFTRDLLGRVTTLTLPDTTSWGYGWDENGNLLTLTEPDGGTAHQFTYTPTDRLETYASPLGATETFSYNLDGELIRREYPSTNGIDWIYNAGGQLTEFRTPEGSDSFTYDATTGQLTRALSRDGQFIDYTYDGSLLTSATWSGLVEGQVSYTYNNELRVTQLDYAGLSLPIAYDTDGLITAVGTIQLTRDPANGLLTQLQDGDFLRTYAYNAHGELSHTTASHAGNVLYDVTYTYDDLGRISQKVETIEGTTHTFEYAYDAIGQLIEVKRDALVVESYQYDEVGNRIGMTNLLTGVTLTADDYEYDDDNKLLRAGSTTYQYDPDRRLLEENRGGQVTRYQYNTDGTLRTVELPGGSVISYLYNDVGERIARAVDASYTSSWLYGNGRLPLIEYDSSGVLRSVYAYAVGASPALAIRDNRNYHIVADHLGSIRLVIDATGAVTRSIVYDAYGNKIADTNPSFDLPMGFVAGIFDPDHELMRFGERDYQPSAGRWTAKDPSIFYGGLSLFEYVGNDPVNEMDHSGLQVMRPSSNLYFNMAVQQTSQMQHQNICPTVAEQHNRPEEGSFQHFGGGNSPSGGNEILQQFSLATENEKSRKLLKTILNQSHDTQMGVFRNLGRDAGVVLTGDGNSLVVASNEIPQKLVVASEYEKAYKLLTSILNRNHDTQMGIVLSVGR